MLMHYEDPVNRAPHSKLVVLVPHTLEPGRHGGILLKKGVLRAKGVVGEGVEVNSETRVPWEAWLSRDCCRGMGKRHSHRCGLACESSDCA